MYVVAGVSGRTGAVVAGALLDAGQPVRVLVRRTEQGQPWRARGAQVAVADLQAEGALAQALEGARGAYLLSPQDARAADPLGDGQRIAASISGAVRRSGLPHLVFLSALGAQHPDQMGIAGTLRAAEQQLAAVPGAVTHLRAAYLLENWAPVLGASAQGVLPSFLRPDLTLPMVATRDAGTAAARCLLEGLPPGEKQVVELAGPRDESPQSLAEILSQLLGRPVRCQHATTAAVEPTFIGMGASPAFAQQVRLLHEALEEGRGGLQGGTTRLCRGTTSAATLFAELLAGGGR